MFKALGLSKQALIPIILLLLVAPFLMAATVSVFQHRAPDVLNVVGTYPLEGAPFTDSIVVYFDAPLSLSAQVQAKPMTFAPPMVGTFEVGVNTIAFKPKGMDPHRSYEVTLDPSLQSVEGKALNPNQRKFVMKAWGPEPTPTPQPTATPTPIPFLRVNNVQTVESGDEVLYMDLSFNLGVDAAKLQEHVTIKNMETDNDLGFYTVTGGVNTNQRLAIQADETVLTFQVTLAKDLTAETGQTLEFPYTHQHHQVRNDFLAIENTWWDNRGRDGMALQVRVDHGLGSVVQTQDLLKHIEITPPITNLRVEYSDWDDNSFVVIGDWEVGVEYEFKLKQGLRYTRRDTLTEDVTRNVRLTDVEPFFGFGYPDRYYFPRRSGIALPLETRGVSEAKLTLYRLFPSNLIVSLRDINEGKGSPHFNEQWCEKIGNRTVSITGAQSKLTKTPLNLDELFAGDKKGIYCLQAESNNYNNDTKIVLYTDLGILSHWDNKDLIVFVHDLFTLEPKASAAVRLYSSKSQLMAEGTTDAQGMLAFRDLPQNLGIPKTVVVESGEDATFLQLENRPHNSPDVDGSMLSYNRDSYQGFVYADRDLYRPGETVHLRWIVRTRYGDALANVPLQLTVVKSTGQDLLSQPITLSELGTGTLDVQTAQSDPTGFYEAKVHIPGDENPIGRYTFKVEDFVPHRMKAEVALNETYWLPGQDYNFDVKAMHLFGAPASDRKTDAYVVFKKGGFKPEDWKNFTFDNDSQYLPETVQLGEGLTDEVGEATYTFSYSPSDDVTFPMQATVIGNVFEPGGRAVSGKAVSTFLPSETVLGIAASSNTGGGVQVHAAAVRADGSPADLAQVSVTLERESWSYYVRRFYDRNEPNWTKSYQTIETRTVDLKNGRGSTTFDLNRSWGSYRLRVHSDDLPQYSTIAFYCYGDECRIGQPTEPGLVKLTLDKDVYDPGENAVLRIESPFDGHGLVVVQGETIQRMIPVEVVKGSAVLNLPIQADDYPNVWAEVTVVHTVQTEHTQVYPYSSFSMKNIRVHRPDRQLSIAFPNLPVEIPPETTTTFDVNVALADGSPVQAELTLAAVDEGIHNITHYSNPEPYEWFSQPRQPKFNRAHYYDHVVYDFEKMEPGGDGEEELLENLVTHPLQNWIKPVALWSGTVTTDANGHASITMEIPKYTGQLRLVAVANTDRAVGSAATDIYVRKPYMIQASLPRFLLPDDSMSSRIVLYNHTKENTEAEISWSAEGAVREVSGTTTLPLPANGELTHAIDFSAQPLIGQGTVRWKAVIRNAGGEIKDTLEEELPLPVLPPIGFQSANELIVLQPNEQAMLRNERFQPDPRNRMEVTVTANPAWRIQDALSFLIGYPYGCVEQTLSKVLPLYLLRQNQKLIEVTLRDDRIEPYLQAGINRLFSMQTPEGGLSMWPGGLEPYPYASVYALHFLTLVKKDRQFSLPEQNFAALQNYVRNRIMNGDSASESDLYMRAYALYTLALDGDLEALEQIPRYDQIAIPKAARYLLAAALAMNTQDMDKVNFHLTKAPSYAYTIREMHYTLNSEIRNVAVQLLALNQITGNETQKAELAERLIAYLKENRYGTTQETSFIVTALGGYLNSLSLDTERAAATVQSPTETVSVSKTDTYHSRYRGAEISYSVKNDGTSPVYVNLTTYGIPKDLPKDTVKNGMAVNRKISFEGNEHTGAFLQGDTYVVEVQIHMDQSGKNIVISDLLPAGFEVENPRLNPDAFSEEEFKGAVTPTHLEIRDDRVILAFDDLQSGDHKYYYVVRAVTPGRYQYPPIHGECMYDPSINSTSLPSMIEVK